jgi:hypothetical protein
MRFIKERLTLDFIRRRVAEEEARSDREVTEVRLNPAEWMEFTLEHRIAYGQAEVIYPVIERISPHSLGRLRTVRITRG